MTGFCQGESDMAGVEAGSKVQGVIRSLTACLP